MSSVRDPPSRRVEEGGEAEVQLRMGTNYADGSPGLLESAYEGAICVELKHRGLSLERQVVYPLAYRGEYVGAYPADLVVEGAIILELKSVKGLTAVMEGQIINYLKLSGLPVGYLLNFHNARVEWRRFVHGDTCGCSSKT